MFPRALALATDLYELTMAAAYFPEHAASVATFELYVRELPANRNYLVVAGVEQALDYLEALRFTGKDVAYLRAHPSFRTVGREFFDYLLGFRFDGDVWAMREGTVAFASEPILRVSAPIIAAQLVETFLLATVNFQTMVASKAARVVAAAAGRDVIEFGARRAHGSEAALYAARAAYVAGCVGTSNVEAGLRFGMPTMGTMAHSFVMSFDDEIDAFRHYLQRFPEAATLLIDTYDTVDAARRIVAAGLRPAAVRLDSGNLTELSRTVRRVLDEGGLRDVRIFASGDLDEWAIARLLADGAPVDAFGVGTRLATSSDAPSVGGVYKLVEVQTGREMRGRIKTSTGKATYPGKKQVWRCRAANGGAIEDVIALADEAPIAEAAPLLERAMQGGKRLGVQPKLAALREHCREELATMPPALLGIDERADYPVRFSARLEEARQRLAATHPGR